MIIQEKTKGETKMSVKVVILITGEMLIGKQVGELKFEKLMSCLFQEVKGPTGPQISLGLQPWKLGVSSSPIEIKEHAIAAITDPSPTLEKTYLEHTSSIMIANQMPSKK